MLRFKVGPFPVAVELSFWFTALLLSGLNMSVPMLALWVGVVFISVLIHELGHALVALRLGGRPEIVLRAFGGVTLPFLRQRPGALAQLALAVSGPLAGLSLGLIALLVESRLAPQQPLVAAAIYFFKYTSFAWAVLNLLPVLDLDGGHAMEAILEGVRRKPSRRQAAWVSIFVAGAAGLVALYVGQTFMAIFFAMFLAKNASELRGGARRVAGASEAAQAGPAADERADVARLTEVARQALAAGDDSGALAAAQLLEASEGPYRQAAGLRIRAGVMLSGGKLAEAGLLGGRSFALYAAPDAAVVAARANLRAGDRDTAAAWLRRAVEAGAPIEAVRRDRELSQLLEAPAA